MSSFRPDEPNAVYIGESVTIKGSIYAQDIVVVDGTLEGEISCSQLIVGASGVVNGSITVSEADIYGMIGTDISVKNLLILRASGRIEGKWVYGEIEVEKGAILLGTAESTGLRNAEHLAPKHDSGEKFAAKGMQYKKRDLAKLPPSLGPAFLSNGNGAEPTDAVIAAYANGDHAGGSEPALSAGPSSVAKRVSGVSRARRGAKGD